MNGGRAARYGDGLFETMRASAAGVPLWNEHLRRLHVGALRFGLDVPQEARGLDLLLRPQLENTLAQLTPGAVFRLRLDATRAGGGYLAPETDVPEFHWTWSFYQSLDNGPVDLLIDRRATKAGYCLTSRFKTLSAAEYVLAARSAVVQGFSDCLLTSANGGWIETTRCNVFYNMDGVWHTPAISVGCVGGVMRAWTLRMLQSLGIEVRLVFGAAVSVSSVRQAFVTNALRGAVPVSRFYDAGVWHELDSCPLADQLNKLLWS